MNKKTILAIILLFAVLLPLSADAAVPNAVIAPTNVGGAFTNTSFMGVVQNIANFVIAFITILGIIFIIWGAIQYVTSGGDEASIERAKNTIVYALVGLFIAAMAYALESLVLTTLVS